MGVHSFSPIYKGNFVWGYTVFPLNNMGKFCVRVHSFSPLYKECSNCVSNKTGTVFSLNNIRDELPNSVDLFEPLGTVVILPLIVSMTCN